MKLYSLNDFIFVRLTEHGRNILNNYGSSGKEQADGWHKFQVWEFVNIFGQHIYEGAQLVVEETQFKIKRA